MRTRIVGIVALISFGLFICLYMESLSKAQTTPTPISGKFYKFEKIARVGQDNIDALTPLVSINDNGTVAFVAHKSSSPTDVQQIFARKVNGPNITAVTAPTLADGTTRRFFGSMQINNSDQILAMHNRSTALAPHVAYDVRRWDANGLESSALVADENPSPPAGASYFSIFNGTSINNAGQAAIFAKQ